MKPTFFGTVAGGATAPIAIRINAGGAADLGFSADTGYTGGAVWNWASGTLHTDAPSKWLGGIVAPPVFTDSEIIYQYLRYLAPTGTINYLITGLTPAVDCLVRIHVFTSSGTIPIQQSIEINGVEVDPDTAYSTGVTIKEFTVASDGSGELSIDFIGSVFAGVSAIEVLQPVPSPVRTVFYPCGDSLTDCSSLVGDTNTWPAVVANAYNGNQGDRNSTGAYVYGYDFTKAWNFPMIAQSGNTIATQTSYIPTFITTRDSSLYPRQIAFLWCGTNNVLSSDSAASIEDEITAFFAALPSGITTTGIATIIPCASTGPQNTVRLAVNSWILANSLNIDFVIDLAAVPELSDYTNTTYFNPDQIHLTAAGEAVVAAQVIAELETLFP